MLAALLEQPRDDAGWERFAFHNRISHDEIRTALNAKGGQFQDLVLFPITADDWPGWLERHALTHQQIDSATGQISSDLTSLDPRDAAAVAHWIEIHQLEHYAVEAALGISS